MVYPTAQGNLLKALEEARENYRDINRETVSSAVRGRSLSGGKSRRNPDGQRKERMD
jgi:hypothetical protein